MKKILLILISLYKFSFAYNYSSASDFAQVMDNLICTVGSSTGSSRSYTYSYCDQNKSVTTYSSGSSGYTYGTDTYSYVNSACTLKTTSINYYNCYSASTAQKENGETGICQGQGIFTIGSDTYQCSDVDNEFTLLTPVENGGYNSDGSIFCNSGYVENSGFCSAVPDNSSGFDENGDLICNSPYVSNGTSCNLPPNTNPDGTCSEGSYKDLVSNSCQEIQTTDNNDGSTTTNDGNGETTDYPTGTTVNYNPETGVTTTTYPDGTSIVEYPDGTTTNNGGSVSGGTGSDNGSGNTDNSDSIDNGDTSSFICDDGAPSLVTSTGFQTCDRTCESVGFILDTDGSCISSIPCPDGQTKTGTDLLGNPICYEMSNNADIDLNKIETLLGNIKDNTSLDKNSNKQLGTINNNIVRTNGKLEAVKGGLSIINKNVVGTNAKLEAVKGGLAIVDTSVNKVNSNIEASNGYLDGIATMLSDMVSPIDSDKQNQYESQISSHLTNTLSDSFSKYSNVLGFGSSYGTTPSNITVTLFNTEFTLIDFSVLDNFVSIIRSLFLSLAHLYGFMFFLRGSK